MDHFDGAGGRGGRRPARRRTLRTPSAPESGEAACHRPEGYTPSTLAADRDIRGRPCRRQAMSHSVRRRRGSRPGWRRAGIASRRAVSTSPRSVSHYCSNPTITSPCVHPRRRYSIVPGKTPLSSASRNRPGPMPLTRSAGGELRAVEEGTNLCADPDEVVNDPSAHLTVGLGEDRKLTTSFVNDTRLARVRK